MKKFGIVSYNIHGNYTNYGSVLQSYALQTALNKHFASNIEVKIIDYWPEAIVGKDPLNPLKKEKQCSLEFADMVKQSMPAITENYSKIKSFIKKYYNLSNKPYTNVNFDESLADENLDGYIIGSDAIWMIDFFGYDRGFWGDFSSMKKANTIAYAASFGESIFDEEKMKYLDEKVQNFKAIGLREPKYLEHIKEHTSRLVEQVVDPTLLLEAEDYEKITAKRCVDDSYILIYSRKYDSKMDEYADTLAKKYGFKVVEISLRAQNADRHQMYYHAGVEEFLSLIKNAENVVTNSLHAAIFATMFHKPISFFDRGNASYKVKEFLKTFNLESMIVLDYNNPMIMSNSNYDVIDNEIETRRASSYEFLKFAFGL